MPAISTFVAIALGIIIFLISLMVNRSKTQRKRKLYEDFAIEKGLEFQMISKLFSARPTALGKLENLDFELHEDVVGSGKSRKVYTVAKFTNSPFPFEFKIGKEHFFSRVGKLFGFKDIEFRDEKFDRKFLLKSTDEGQFRAIMNYSIQADLSQIANDLSGTIENAGSILSYRFLGEITKEEKLDHLKKVIEFMVKLQKQ
jgi:hypothetical protein